MPTLDIFKADGFSLMSLTNRINQLPFVPQQAGKLGIFEEEGIRTTTLAIENYKGTITLIPNTPRSAPPNENTRIARNLRTFIMPHLPIKDTISAEEVQNIRSFGAESDLMTVMEETDKRMLRMIKSLDATVEYQRIGALKGKILDADGSTVIYDLFAEFGVSQTTEDFRLSSSTEDVLGHCTAVREAMQTELGGDGGDDLEVTAFVGKTWFKSFISHAKVSTAYQYYQTVQQNMNPLQRDLRYKGFTFGGITFYVYRGSVPGSGGSAVDFMPASEGVAFPTNVPQLFLTKYAPANYMETVNTTGLPRYAKTYPLDLRNTAQVVETQSNPLSLCTRPATLIKLTTS